MRVIRIGERYSILTDEVETYDLLPVKTYVVMYNDKEGFYLTEHTNIEVCEKIYGVHESKVKKVLHAFERFQRSLGTILSGDKGIGKSVFAKLLCQKALEQGYPVLIVDEAYRGIARFIEKVEQECVVLFDEFDKTFKSSKENDEQAKLLSLFDGTAGGKKMYIVTCNELRGLNDYIVNRPGRFHYHFRFEYPTAEAIREYLEDKLEKQFYGEIEKVIEFAGRVNLNYDCLRAITFELNQGSAFAEAITELNILNVDLEEYDVYLYFENGEVFHRYNYRTNLYEERGYDWISMQTKQGISAIDVKFEKHHLHYDMEKGAVVIPGDLLLLDYDDYEDDIKIEKSVAKYLAFVKSKRNSIHYLV